MNLRECLSGAPYAVLVRIGAQYAVPLGHNRRRAHVLDRLLAAPLQRLVGGEIERIGAGDSEARHALQILAHAGGCCDRASFEHAFGPMALARSVDPDSHHVGAWLAARGIIFAQADRVILPDEFVADIPLPWDARAPLVEQQPATPLYDLSIALIAAQRGALRLDRRTGRVARRTVAALLRVCSPAASEDSLHFIVHVATMARLLEPAHGGLEPGPRLDAWLAYDPIEQLAALWRGWQACAAPQRGHRRRQQETCRDCPSLRGALVRALADRSDVGTDAANAHPACMDASAGARIQTATDTTIGLRRGELALLWPSQHRRDR